MIMKQIYRYLLFTLLLLSCLTGRAQTIFWTESFNNGCLTGCVVTGVNTGNGAWSMVATGPNDADANDWFVSCSENGNLVGACGTGCGNDATLHVSSLDNFMCPGGDCGAAYDAGGGFLTNTTTNKRAQSPTINATGYSNIQIKFKYIHTGDGTTDNCSLYWYDGTTWNFLVNIPKSVNTGCGGQGKWTSYTSASLPAGANNNSNLKIGFNWMNNNDGLGTDPSFACDSVQLLGTVASPFPVVHFTVNDTTLCVGQCVFFNDQSTNNPTTWDWTFQGASPGTSNVQDPTNICYNTPGTFAVTLIATNGSGSDTLTKTGYITVTPYPTVTVSPNVTTICAGSSDTLIASGANTYTWTPALGLNISTGDTVIASPTISTSYDVTGDTAGCTNFATVVVNVVTAIVAEAGNNVAICSGDSTQLNASGGSNYSWNPIAGLSDPNIANPFASPGSDITYTVTVSSGSCPPSTDTVVVTVNPNPIASITGDVLVCPGYPAELTASGGTVYHWSNFANTATVTVNPMTQTTYTVTVTDIGCTDTESWTVNVYPGGTVSASADTTMKAGNSYQMHATNGTNWVWSPETGLSCTTCQNPVASPAVTTTYTVVATDANGCTSSDVVTVNITSECGSAYVPNAFSPNNDGQNDVLYVFGGEFKNLHLLIYDRHGEKIFETTDPSQGWDGTYKGQKQPCDVYYYYLSAECNNGDEIEKKGDITILN
jgi:gliding motility-associated-like protein